MPHLAFVEEARYDRVLRMIRQRNACYRRTDRPEDDPLRGRPKKATRWPGQHIRCGVCGRSLVWGGHGRKDFMMCNGVRERRCWNSGTIHVERVARLVINKIYRQVAMLPEFDHKIRDAVKQQVRESRDTAMLQRTKLERDVSAYTHQIERLLDAIESGQSAASLDRRLREREAQLAEAKDQLAELASDTRREVDIPSKKQLHERLKEMVGDLDLSTGQLRRTLRILVPDLYVLPHRLLDGGKIVQRVEITMRLTPLLDPGIENFNIKALQMATCELPAYDQPDVVRILDQVVIIRGAGSTKPPTLKSVAQQLSVSERTVQRAEAIAAIMKVCGVSDPYEPLRSVPEDNSKYRSHRHPDYCFEPLPGFPLWDRVERLSNIFILPPPLFDAAVFFRASNGRSITSA